MKSATTTSEIEIQPLPNNSAASSWSPQAPPTKSSLDDISQNASPPTTDIDALQRGVFLGVLFQRHVGYMHVRFGQRGIAIVGPLCHLIPYIVLATHPPYAVLVVMFIFVGFGNGLIDTAWRAWIGNMANANQVSGVLQACYALGGTVAPLIAAGMLAKGGLQWWVFWYVMIAMAGIESISSTWAFWAQTGAVFAAENPRDENAKMGRMREAFDHKLTWIFAAFVFGYVGLEVSLGGWIVVFMTRVRSASTFDATMTSTGFWAGMTVGRIALSFVTACLGEFTSVLVYLAMCLGLELIFWLVPSFIASAVAIALLGMFLGPLFPTAIVLVAKLMPKELHVGSIGFATAFGGSGGGDFSSRGVQMLQPVVVAILVVITGLWCLVPDKGKRGGREKGTESEREAGSDCEKQENFYTESEKLCQTLLETPQALPQDTLFSDDTFSRRHLKDLSAQTRLRSSAIFHSLLFLRLSLHSGSRSGSTPEPFPQPDFGLGFKGTAFTRKQLQRLQLVIGDSLTDCSYFAVTHNMYFPFLFSEVICEAGLDITDWKNAHTQVIILRGLCKLFSVVGRENELHRQINGFSISYNEADVRIWGHYAVIDGDDVKCYRHSILSFGFTDLNGKERWTAYRFVRNIYDLWLPEHFKRICLVIDMLPTDVNFELG
ncbi:hypothetical protein CJF31_00009976 [Rutstroemia sp. NJR-2017a BVV2]|nr:hypothetical protein CJF31_00009976 [Rutstroemia sp. NJR-2017a BVV2]